MHYATPAVGLHTTTDPDDTDLPEETTHQEEPPPLIALHAITGIRSADTMQIRVAIGPHVLTALLDSSSTHNFVSGVAAHRVACGSTTPAAPG